MSEQTVSEKPTSFKCRHIHAAGHRCGSPCLRGEQFCYYHHLARRPLKIHDGVTPQPADTIFTLPHIEDHSGIHLALADVLARIADRTVDPKRAGLLLYGLNTASLNLRRMNAITEAANIAAGPNPHPSEVNAVIQDLELDPDLGPLAPVTEHISPEVKEASLRQRFMDFMNSPARVCQRCVERERLDANRAEAGRLILEREREEPNNLEIRRLADRIRATLPDLKASADDDLGAPCQTASPSDVGIHPSKRNCHPERSDGPAFCEAPSSGAPSKLRLGGHRSRQRTTILPTLHAVAEEAPLTKRRCRTTRVPHVSPLRRGISSRTLKAGELKAAKPAPPLPPGLATVGLCPHLPLTTDHLPLSPTPTDPADLTRRTTRLTRAFRHRFHALESPTPPQRASS
jgi:hypothetical protein